MCVCAKTLSYIYAHVFPYFSAPDDFGERTSMTLELDQTTANVSVNLPIINDVVAERTETFQACLSLINGNLTNIAVSPNLTNISIEDDDCK